MKCTLSTLALAAALFSLPALAADEYTGRKGVFVNDESVYTVRNNSPVRDYYGTGYSLGMSCNSASGGVITGIAVGFNDIRQDVYVLARYEAVQNQRGECPTNALLLIPREEFDAQANFYVEQEFVEKLLAKGKVAGSN
jgi:hypothetical protein